MKMPKKWNASTRVRLIGLWASVIAVAALSTTVLSGNPSAGFGRSITRDEQVFLLLIAALLCALRLIAYLIQRRRTPQSATGPLLPPRRARETNLREIYEFRNHTSDS